MSEKPLKFQIKRQTFFESKKCPKRSSKLIMQKKAHSLISENPAQVVIRLIRLWPLHSYSSYKDKVYTLRFLQSTRWDILSQIPHFSPQWGFLLKSFWQHWWISPFSFQISQFSFLTFKIVSLLAPGGLWNFDKKS